MLDEFKHIFTHDPERSRGPMLRRSDIREGGYSWFQRVSPQSPSPMVRQQMIAILERHLPASCTVHPKKRLVSYMEPEQEDTHSTSPIRLEFADGTTTTTDILIGADGIRSAVRKAMFEAASEDDRKDKADLKQYIDATFTGMIIYRTLVSAETLRKEHPENFALREMTVYVGKGRYLVAYPVAKGTMINFAAVVCDPALTGTNYEGHWMSNATRDELVEYFNDFEYDVRTLVKLCEKPSKWALHVVKPLPFCVRDRVALIGDASHAMMPYFGAGAGQAIDDAFVLGRLIAHPLTTLPRVHDALRIYEEIRLLPARSVASFSLSTGWMYSFMAPGYYDGGRNGVRPRMTLALGSYEREGMENIKQEILRRWDILDGSESVLLAWANAELKLQAFGGPTRIAD
ncbi:hypothetical protein EV363DRAFT_1339980 [Boletus edulis]|nr:hypothetical protein EV363DRAFT_1339980 [Boletus edulis]